jgi:tetratricopeptide (TPR) repeat protein
VKITRRLASTFAVLVLVASLLFAVAVYGEDANDKSGQKTFNVRKSLKAGIKNFEKGEYESAIIMLDSVLASDSGNPDAALYKGKILARQGDSAAAVQVLEQGVTGSPRSSRLKTLLARFYLNQNEDDKAIELVESILVIRPNEGEALYIKGQGLLRKGDTLQAVDLLERALEISLKRNRR